MVCGFCVECVVCVTTAASASPNTTKKQKSAPPDESRRLGTRMPFSSRHGWCDSQSALIALPSWSLICRNTRSPAGSWLRLTAAVLPGLSRRRRADAEHSDGQRARRFGGVSATLFARGLAPLATHLAARAAAKSPLRGCTRLCSAGPRAHKGGRDPTEATLYPRIATAQSLEAQPRPALAS